MIYGQGLSAAGIGDGPSIDSGIFTTFSRKVVASTCVPWALAHHSGQQCPAFLGAVPASLCTYLAGRVSKQRAGGGTVLANFGAQPAGLRPMAAMAGQYDSGQAAERGAILYQLRPLPFTATTRRVARGGKLTAIVGAKPAYRDTGSVTRVEHFTHSL